MTYIYRVLRNGPAGLWSMDSQPIVDSSGYNKDATFTGAPKTTRPIVAKGIAAQQLSAGDVISYPIDKVMISGRETRSFTLEAWVKASVGNTKILGRGNSGLFIDGTTLRFTIDMGAGYSIEYAGLTAGSVYHIVGVYDVQGFYMYVNGVKVAGSDIDTPGQFADTSTTLSSTTDSTATFDSVAVYSYPLASSTINAHFSVGTDYPDISTLTGHNGGTHYEFFDGNADVYGKISFPDYSWSRGTFSGGVSVVDNKLVNLYSDTDAQWQTGSWTFQELFESDSATTIQGSRIKWNSNAPVTVEKSEDGGTTWKPLVNGGQVVGTKPLTAGYSVSIRVTIPASTEQVSVEYLSATFYSSTKIRGNDEDLPATILNPTVTTWSEDRLPVASFDDNVGISFADGSGGMSIPGDTTFGGYFAVEMAVKITSDTPNATILQVNTSTLQPIITTDASSNWVFSNIDALYVDGVALASGTAVSSGEWHHILAVFPEATATVFTGNSSTSSGGVPMQISYVATYPELVSSTDAQAIYNTWAGAPSVVVPGNGLMTIGDGDPRPPVGLMAATSTAAVMNWESSGWKFLQVSMSDSVDRSAIGFDDSTWVSASAPFGKEYNGAPSVSSWPHIQTAWASQSGMWARKIVNVPTGIHSVSFSYRLDNIMEIYWDGAKVYSVGKDQYVGEGDEVVTIDTNPGSHTLAIKAVDDNYPYLGDRTYADVNITAKKKKLKAYQYNWAIISGG